MAEGFDPYYVWLGIPPGEQPPNNYRLLGIKEFESDGDVITNAADRQMSHLRTYQIGTNASDSQRLLNEVASARRCLLDSEQKPVYDDELRGRTLQPAKPPRAAAPIKPSERTRTPAPKPLPQQSPDADTPPAIDSGQRKRRPRSSATAAISRQPAWLLVVASIGVGVVLCVAIVTVVLAFRDPDQSVDDGNPSVANININSSNDGGIQDNNSQTTQSVARLTLVGECQFEDGSQRRDDEDLYADQILTLTVGRIEINYTNGAKVLLDAPVQYELESKAEAILHSGTATLVSLNDNLVLRSPNGQILERNRAARVAADGSVVYVESPAPSTVPSNPRTPVVVTPSPTPTARKGLVAHWKLDGNGRDATGHGHDVGFAKNPVYVDGPVGEAVQLEPNQISFSTDVLDKSSQFTIAMWVNVSKPPQIFSNRTAAFMLYGGTLRLSVVGGKPSLYLANANLSARQRKWDSINWQYDLSPHTAVWTHLAIAFDQRSGLAELWVNGKSIGRQRGPQASISFGKGRFIMLKGAVDDMRIYDTWIPGQGINQLFASGNNTDAPVNPKPVDQSPATPVVLTLPDTISLPPVDDPAPVQIGSLPAAGTTALDVTLLGGDAAIPGSAAITLTGAETAPNDARIWNVQLSANGEATVLAQLRLADEHLTFQWTEHAAIKKSAGAVANCLLQFRAAEREQVIRLREHIISLRKPLPTPPLTVDLARGMDQVRLKLDSAPPVGDIYIEIGDVDIEFPGPPTLSDTQRLVPMKGGQRGLNFGEGELKTLQLTVLGNTSAGHVVSLRSSFQVATMSAPMAFTKNNLRKISTPISQAIASLSPQVKSLESKIDRAFYSRDIKRYTQQLKPLAARLSILQQAQQQAAQLTQAYESLHGQGTIQFRLKYAVGNEEIVLADSTLPSE
jgi:hypothetical protein